VWKKPAAICLLTVALVHWAAKPRKVVTPPVLPPPLQFTNRISRGEVSIPPPLPPPLPLEIKRALVSVRPVRTNTPIGHFTFINTIGTSRFNQAQWPMPPTMLQASTNGRWYDVRMFDPMSPVLTLSATNFPSGTEFRTVAEWK
jgi:hypothetical protein